MESTETHRTQHANARNYRKEYNPQFFTDSLQSILKDTGLDPLQAVKVKSGNQVCFVSPLGHREGSMAAVIDFAILNGNAKAEDIINSMNNDPDITERRQRLLKTKEEITIQGLILKINAHIDYYVSTAFEKHFNRIFKFDKKVIREIRRAARAYQKYEWKPGLKRYRQALDAAAVKIAEEFGQEPTPIETAPSAQVLLPAPAEGKSSTCMGIKKDGTPCKGRAGKNGYCPPHSSQKTH